MSTVQDNRFYREPPDGQPTPPESDRDYLEAFMCKVKQMRTYQKNYFARKQETDKRGAIKMEGIVDELLKRLKLRGYDADRYLDKSKQGRLL